MAPLYGFRFYVFFAANQFFGIYIQYLCYLEKYFETGLSAITYIGVHYAETLAKLLCKPCLLDSTLFEHLFYAVHVCVYVWGYYITRPIVSLIKKSSSCFVSGNVSI